MNGDLGLFPGTAITGFPPATVNGTININNPAAMAAQADLLTAYNFLFSRAAGATKTGNIGGHNAATRRLHCAFDVVGRIIGQPDPRRPRRHECGLDLPDWNDSRRHASLQVILANGAQASNIFWQVGSSATIDVGAVMQGNILALTSITMNGGATLNGRALALNGAVTAGGSGGSLPGCQ